MTASETTRTIAEIRADHPEHVRVGYRCDCTVDLLAALDHVAARLEESRPHLGDCAIIRELIAYIGAGVPSWPPAGPTEWGRTGFAADGRPERIDGGYPE